MKAGSIFAATVLLGLSACATAPAPRPVSRPFWECTVGRPGQDAFTAYARLDEAGRQIWARWMWFLRGEPLSFRLEGNLYGDRRPDVVDSTFSIFWNGVHESVTRLPELRLELTSNPDWGGWFVDVPFAGQFINGGDSYLLSASWPDTQALARGADQLTLVLRRRDGSIAARQPMPREILARADEAVRVGLRQLEATVSDRQHRCFHGDEADMLDTLPN